MQSILRLSLLGLLALFAIVATLLTSWLDARETGEAGPGRGAGACRGVLKLGSIKLQIVMDVSQTHRRNFRVALVQGRRDAVSPAGNDES
jgi:hypothetical protein